jgi:GTP-binding protein
MSKSAKNTNDTAAPTNDSSYDAIPQTENIRNIAIIAHVDHGKTTLCESLILACSNKPISGNQLDNDNQESQRGITILAKIASCKWNNVHINFIDTPGHHDFQTEVERVFKTGMPDGALVIIDPLDGIMPQTIQVIKQAVQAKVEFIVIFNKVDRDGVTPERIQKVYNDFIELMYNLASNEQGFSLDKILNIKVMYASGRTGVACTDLKRAVELATNPDLSLLPYTKKAHLTPEDLKQMAQRAAENMRELLDAMAEIVPAPHIESNEYTKCSITMLDYDAYTGKICKGKVHAGSLKLKDKLLAISHDGVVVEVFNITKLFRFHETRLIETTEVKAGDLYALCGSSKASINDTLASSADITPFAPAKIEQSMLSVCIFANRSPLAGKEGSKLNSRQLKDQCEKEAQINPGFIIESQGEIIRVNVRGVMSLEYNIEKFRRTGTEMMIGSPTIIVKKDDKGNDLHPYEEIKVILMEESHLGPVSSNLQSRNGSIVFQGPVEDTEEYMIVCHIAVKNLLGFESELKMTTSGTARINRMFLEYAPLNGQVHRKVSFLIATEAGTATLYAMDALRDRGMFIIKPGAKVFKNMIVGLNNKEGHLFINVAKEKKLTNVRSAGKDDHVPQLPCMPLTVEAGITYIFEPNVILEVTPTENRLWYEGK